MLRTLFRFLTAAPKSPQQIISPDGRSVVLYAHVDTSRLAPQRTHDSDPKQKCVSGDHRAWLLSMRLDHLRLCSASRCDQLRHLGIVTAGDLLTSDIKHLARELDEPLAARVLKKYVGAIQLAAAVSGMMPSDALLLMSIHRRSIRSLAGESPAVVHRDLQRFALSSKGQRALRGRRLPSTKKIRRWIEACVAATQQRHSSRLRAMA